MREKVLENELFYDMIREGDVEYEVPGVTKLEDLQWKGKADIINHSHQLFDCSDQFLQSGQNKVARAVQAYNEFFVNGEGDFSQYYISKTL